MIHILRSGYVEKVFALSLLIFRLSSTFKFLIHIWKGSMISWYEVSILFYSQVDSDVESTNSGGTLKDLTVHNMNLKSMYYIFAKMWTYLKIGYPDSR